jgi:hypothetical protein
MAHILAGKWRSSIIKNGQPTDDAEFDLKINEGNGLIEQGSKHGNADVEGQASTGASTRHHIKINHKQAPGSKFKGFLLVNGPQLIMVGVANLNPTAFVGEGGLDPNAFFDQEQEIWIATKP